MLRRALLMALISATGGYASAQVPTGADVVAGQAAISQAGNAINVNASSARTIVNWDSFNVGAGNVANFHLPDANSAILNRVTTPNMPSTIAGTVNSNGNVYLVNPSGIVVSSSGMVNTNGFTASTFDIANDNFLAGGALTFADNGSTAAIVNQGTIATGTGGANLIANDIANHGVIMSSGGNITLSGGGSVTLSNGVTYVQPTLNILASGISPTAGLIQNTGTIRATGAATSGGEVYLVNPNGRILHDGTIAAMNVAANDTTTGGHIQIEADDITLTVGSTIDATGTHGGGTVLVGGDWQGSGAMTQATTVTMELGATIDASATQRGDGGTVVLWSDVHDTHSETTALGTVYARGGGYGGNGGMVETSGRSVNIDGFHVDTRSASDTWGETGSWLIDPYDYTIGSSQAATIGTALNTNSVTVTTTNDNSSYGSNGNNSSNGDIIVASSITKTGSGTSTLTLQAARHISVQSGVNITSSGGPLNLHMWADSDNSGDGINQVASNISTNGGWLRFGNNQTATINGISTLVGGDVFFNGSSAQTMSTGGGAVDVYGETILANTAGLTMNTGNGNVNFHGLLNSGNAYSFVNQTGNAGSGTWDQARVDARNGTAGGAGVGDSYLVTINSRLENAIAGLAANYNGAWIGAYRANSNNHAWTWADGPEAGQNFFTQNTGSGGGTVTPGYYANFGSGEPNGALHADRTQTETVGQFFGTAGQWNDLGANTAYSGSQLHQYAVLGYVRETNLAASPITINAGNGAVTLQGAVGNSKALSSFDVTGGAGIAINGGSVSTQGIQTYRSPVILGANTTISTVQNDIRFLSTVNSNNPSNPWNLTTTITPSNVYYWVDWTSWDSGTNTATGTITIGSEVINVSYHNPQGVNLAQASGGTNYWTGYVGAGFSGASPYVSARVGNGPSTSDIIQLRYAGPQTLTFSQSVENLAFSVISMNGNGYGFNQDFTIESHSGLNGAGPGYYGSGNFTRTIVGNVYQLNDGGANGASIGGNSEPHGTIRFGNAFSELTWNSLSNENWNGFTVGVSGTSSTAGQVQFGGDVGNLAGLGAITVNGSVQTSGSVSNASSLNVSGLAALGRDVTTSGNQSYNSAVTLGSDVTLTTTSNGSVNAVSTINGAHALTIQTNGTGDTTLGGTVGGTNALTGLTIATDSLTATGISLAANSAFDVTNSGASTVSGVISGANVTLDKAGSGTLSLSGTNSYGGGTTISSGTLSIISDASLGTAPSSATASHLTINGGTLLVTGNTTLNSNRGIEIGANDATTSVNSGVSVNYEGIVDGIGDFTKAGSGTLQLSGPDTFAGSTRVSGGVLQTNNLSALGSNSAVTLDNTAGVSLSLLSDLTIGSLTGGGTTGGNVSLGSSRLTTGTDNTSTVFAGLVSGTGSLQKSGTGNLTLTSNNSYTGITTIAAGQLIIEHNAPTFATSSIEGPGALTIRSAGDSFNSAFTTSTVPFGVNTSLGALTIGKATNTANVTIGSAINVNGDVNIFGGALALNGVVTTSTGHSVALNASGNVTQSAAITTEELLLQGTGNFSMNNAGNTIGTVAGGSTTTRLGNVAIVNSGSLTIGSVDGTSGLTSSGTVNLATASGDLTVAQNISTTNTTSSAVILNADRSANVGSGLGGNVVIIGGAISLGSGGRGTIYSGSVANSTGLTNLIGSGSGRFRYNSDESASNFSLALGSGLFGIYRQQPTIDVTANNQTITYADALPTWTYTLNGNVNGDAISQIFAAPNVSVAGPTSTSGNYTAADHALSGTGMSASQLGYNVGTIAGGTLTVDAKVITTSLVIDNRIYDGTTDATFTATSNGTVNGDIFSIGGTGTFLNKNVGTAKTVNVIGLNLSGADSGNYLLSNTTDTSTANITAKSLTVSGLVANSKVYDGTTNATIDQSGVNYAGLLLGDDLTLSTITGLFTNKNVANNKTVNLTSMYSGVDVGNYAITNQSTTTANITPKSVVVSGIIASDKTYDGNTVATVNTGSVNLNGKIGGDNLSIMATGQFINKNVGTGKAVTLSSTLGGSDINNYTITNQTSTLGDIFRLNSVTWIGGVTGDWSDPANWAGGAIPDLANVANVIIPNGVTPVFNSTVSGPVQIDSLVGGNLQLDSGTLNVANNVTLDSFLQNGGLLEVGGNFLFNTATIVQGTLNIIGNAIGDTFTQNGGTANIGGDLEVGDFEQNGGTLDVDGSLGVSNSFTQTGSGTIDVIGNVDITHTTGDLTVTNLTGGNVALHSTNGGVTLGEVVSNGTFDVIAGSGNIDQLPGSELKILGPANFNASGNITLNNPNNNLGTPVNASGQNIVLHDGQGGLQLGNIAAIGDFNATSTGGSITQSSTSTITVQGITTLAAQNGGQPADILLSNPNNNFVGPFNADGRDIAVNDGTGGLLFGTIIASRNLTGMSTGGPIAQTSGGRIEVGQQTTLSAAQDGKPAAIDLSNLSNRFTGKVNVTGGQIDIKDSTGRIQYGVVKSGNSDLQYSENISSSVRDTNTRYTSDSSSDTGSPNTDGLVYQLRRLFTDLFAVFQTVSSESNIQSNVTAELLSVPETDKVEIYVRTRTQKPAEEIQ